MPNIEKVVVHYDGTNRGSIYLRDIGMRPGLGGGRGIYVNGQDRYVEYGTDTTLVATSDVLLSCSVLGPDSTGVIRANMVNTTTGKAGIGSFHVDFIDSTAGSLPNP
jgi:hypothetical protein